LRLPVLNESHTNSYTGPRLNLIELQDYKDTVNSLPETDKPSFFGLPANIDRSAQRIVSSQVIKLSSFTDIASLANPF
jgi:dynein heavy chain 2